MDAVHKNFYVYDYLGLHRNNDSAKEQKNHLLTSQNCCQMEDLD